MNSRLDALDAVTRILQVDKTPSDLVSLRDRICSRKTDWPKVLQTANQNLISAALWSELRSLELENEIPLEVQNYLAEIFRLNSIRNQRIMLQTLEVAALCNTLGIEPILLKGAASLFHNIYRDHGSRMLTDIDVLVPRERADDCWELLRTHGYHPHETGENAALQHYPHHLHPLSRAGEYAVIEIHHDVVPPMTSGLLYGATITEQNSRQITHSVSASTERLLCDGHILRVPSWTSRTLHCLLHSAFMESNAYRSGILPLRSLLELALFQHLHGSEIDWTCIAQLLSGSGKQRPLRAWPYLAHRLFGCALPTDWTPSLSMLAHYRRCRWQARWGVAITMKHLSRT